MRIQKYIDLSFKLKGESNSEINYLNALMTMYAWNAQDHTGQKNAPQKNLQSVQTMSRPLSQL